MSSKTDQKISPFSQRCPFSTIGFPVLPNDAYLGLRSSTDPYRCLLSDDGAIAFTHVDLHRNNIIMLQITPIPVIAIVD
jgi:hypothetical protein